MKCKTLDIKKEAKYTGKGEVIEFPPEPVHGLGADACKPETVVSIESILKELIQRKYKKLRPGVVLARDILKFIPTRLEFSHESEIKSPGLLKSGTGKHSYILGVIVNEAKLMF